MNDFDLVLMFSKFSSDEGPLYRDELSTGLWYAISAELIDAVTCSN